MKNILTQLFILLAFLIGSVSIGNAHFIDLDGGSGDMVVISGKMGANVVIPIPGTFKNIDGSLKHQMHFSISQNGIVLFETHTQNTNVHICKSMKINGKVIVNIAIQDFSIQKAIEF